MLLTPEEKDLGRRNFLRAVATPEALSAVSALRAVAGSLRGGPVRLGFVGVGHQGRVLLGHTDPAHGEVRALCDVNPAQLALADDVVRKAGRPPARHYAEWRQMLEEEDLEAVVLGVPLWMHAEIAAGALEAGTHVLCEKMMAWDEAGCERMAAEARKTGRILEIGYQRYYSPSYVAAYHGVVQAGRLGVVHHARLAWHRNQNWRRSGAPPSPDYDPSPWGYPSFEHLINWRLYWRYSKGLFAELGSHQVGVVNWYFGAQPTRVSGSGGVFRFDDGREVQDHVYATWDYPGGRTATFSSIESNALEGNYEAFYGTEGTLILRSDREAYLFGPTQDWRLEGPVSGAAESEARAAAALGWGEGGKAEPRRLSASDYEVSAFCAAIRTGKAIACGPDRAIRSARACIRANESAQQKAPLEV